eukprot:CAMPEP_0170562172 /NCGR_PEP_ID=MMETSP0211-20121228/59133_1 /TAXON_ID=311385 /ORGANISM="Pseudokeronopsis sp., Strain OXSARD2" /LENGTH=55 /DNA_ID=CAMNT_0010878707 /DNA_START=1103 /DNA_END=1270 /DNA_ORIENTATION=+
MKKEHNLNALNVINSMRKSSDFQKDEKGNKIEDYVYSLNPLNSRNNNGAFIGTST